MDQLKLFATPQAGTTSDDYWTPAHVFEQLAITFDLDVAAPPGGIPWVPAARFYTQAEDGLASPWTGRVWMNPPYSNCTPWMTKFVAHRHGIALVQIAKARWFDDLWKTDAALVLNGSRFKFAQGGIFMPTVFVAFGDECVEAIARMGRVR